MSLPDSTEYWWPPSQHRKHRPTPRKPHDCKPRGGVPGTPNRWKCPICGRRFASITGKLD
jgi:hypothetical protein